METAAEQCEQNREYLVYSEGDGYEVLDFKVKGTFRGFRWRSDYPEPTHWMPLPPAPQEE